MHEDCISVVCTAVGHLNYGSVWSGGQYEMRMERSMETKRRLEVAGGGSTVV